MLHGLLKWCLLSSSTPQDAFKRVHARLACPPLPSRSDADRSGAITPESRVVDPYHFIVCQHGVLGSAADFENVIVDAFVNHEVSVLEATEIMAAAEREEAAVRTAAMSAAECAGERGASVRGEFSGSPLPLYGNPCPTYRCSSGPPSASVPVACIPDTSGARHTVVSFTSSVPTVPGSTTTSVSSANDNVMPRTEVKEVLLEAAPMKAAAAAQRHQWQAASMRDIADSADKASGLHKVAPGSNMDDALAARQHARRAAYKAAYRLQIEYPNRMNGRLYRSGNLQCFSPGSNEYLRTDAGTQVCARRMLAEVVPALQTWLNEVESKEQQRRAKWEVYARTVGTSDAARLSTEAAAPLPICFSVMAHSFGGIIQREFLYLLLVDQAETRASDAMLFHDIVTLRQRLQRLNVSFENFLTVATPHCGAGECLWWPIYFGAWCLARMKLCQTYDELILSDTNRILQRRLLDEPHLRVLQLFRRRVLFANTHRDILVGFGTCSLIFENVDTDHTKFIGVPPRTAHCAAAFANEATEVSKPVLLRSFEEMEQEEAYDGGSDSSSSVRHDSQRSASTRAKSYTMKDLVSSLAPSSAAAAAKMVHQVSHASARECAGTPVSVVEGYTNDTDFMTATLRPQATSSSVPGLTASPTSTLPSYSQSPMPDSTTATRTQSLVFAASWTIGRTIPAHNEETVRVEDVAAPLADHMDECRNELDNGSQSSTSAASTVGSLLSRPFFLLRRRDSLILPSPLLRRSICSSSEGVSTSDVHGLGDVGSVTSSRRSRNSSTVTSLLRDPRWASERVRRVASTVHAEVERWLWTPTTTPRAGETSTLGESNGNAAAAAESVMTFSARTSVVVPAESSMALMSATKADVPQYRQTPRAIAATLRRTMSWRVRAIRLDNILPAGHVACLGNWAFLGRSPSVVQAAAEEMLIIL